MTPESDRQLLQNLELFDLNSMEYEDCVVKLAVVDVYDEVQYTSIENLNIDDIVVKLTSVDGELHSEVNLYK